MTLFSELIKRGFTLRFEREKMGHNDASERIRLIHPEPWCYYTPGPLRDLAHTVTRMANACEYVDCRNQGWSEDFPLDEPDAVSLPYVFIPMETGERIRSLYQYVRQRSDPAVLPSIDELLKLVNQG